MRATCLILAVVFSWSPPGAAAGEHWPQFRGPCGDGHAEGSGFPLRWSETDHVVWKTPIHDRGWSSPVIWGDQLWVTTATEDGRQLFAVAVDCPTGKIIYDLRVFDVEHPQRIAPINSYASPTPVIEAGRVYVHYGTYGTACIDTDTGKVLWTRRDLNCDHHMGPGSSPILFDDLLIFHVDGMDVQYVIALDKHTGKTVWKTDRSVDYSRIFKFFRKAFCTPTVIDFAGRLQLISPGGKAMMAYDPHTGEELWKVNYFGWSIAPRPVYGDGLVFVIIDYERPELWAVRPDGAGDVSETHVVWKLREGMPATPSLLLIGPRLYMVNDDGIASCVEAKTGKLIWRQRLGGDFAASPLYAGGHIYFCNQRAVTTVIEPGEQCRIVATNRLDGQMMASPAAVGKALFLRTDSHVYRIEEDR